MKIIREAGNRQLSDVDVREYLQRLVKDKIRSEQVAINAIDVLSGEMDVRGGGGVDIMKTGDVYVFGNESAGTEFRIKGNAIKGGGIGVVGRKENLAIKLRGDVVVTLLGIPTD